MKPHLQWQAIPREALAEHLEQVDIAQSQSLSGCTLYRCRQGGHESIALALPDGSGLLIDLNRPHNPWLERRRRGKSAPDDTADTPATDPQ